MKTVTIPATEHNELKKISDKFAKLSASVSEKEFNANKKLIEKASALAADIDALLQAELLDKAAIKKLKSSSAKLVKLFT